MPLDDDAIAFLRRPIFARLATTGRDGYPHVVPIWHDVDVDVDGAVSVWFVCDRTSAKTRNALADPRAAVVIGGDREDAAGWMLRGRITVHDDPGHAMTHRMIDRYEPGPRNAELRELWGDDDIVVLRLHVERASKVF